MDEADEVAALRARANKLERDLRQLAGNLAVAESAAKVAKHGRDELSTEVARLRKLVREIALVAAPLGLLLRQLELACSSGVVDPPTWQEAHAAARKLLELTGAADDELPAPYPPAPSAMPPPRGKP
jgi:hypothetical protein